LCVKIAALTHDIGHGPFSHVYEVFVKKVLPGFLMEDPSRRTLYKNYPDLPEGWQHESTSLMMIDLLLKELGLSIDEANLDEPLKKIQNDSNGVGPRAMRVYGVSGLADTEAILTSRDFIFIKECIWGGPLPEHQGELIGRPDRCHEWLYDIVNNRRSGLDVDKLDYFARDERRAKGEAGKIDEGMIQNAIVAWAKCTEPTTCKRCRQPATGDVDHKHDGKHLMICYDAKMVERCMSFFGNYSLWCHVATQSCHVGSLCHVAIKRLSH
jgi:HD superfamily phosphohydrolase